ncbi:TonB-dependent receptor [Marixanthomonas ophiurae]|uniref:TonB-dependent receptor n=1 Tax=Marixanthomonas ophiurae TaxID=387659 RepID=A0A3E1QBJ5_9FLAO|nr:TonB-dependent receptor [Marixanthomonas ophiurae]RFN59505.1 TonB-dependent receptor [Marixanthomonas ophiurae]
MKKTLLFLCLLVLSSVAFSQTKITGTVTDQNQVPILGANIIIVGTNTGTVSDYDGNFLLTVNQEPPFTLQVSSVGFQSVTEEVTALDQDLLIVLPEGDKLDEVIISASRTPESVRESPVTIERIDARDIENSSSPNFYTSLENLKGIDVNKGGLTYNSVNARGFAGFANTRFVQLVDGMDNASPALNFVIGNFLGVNELDVQSVEILPGASSALYGANAFNGILFMTTKSPFDDQGISVYYKTGITSQEAAGDNRFYDFGIRAAHKFSDKVAAKASFSYLNGTDWFATDYSQYTLNEPGESDFILPFRSGLAHDGINIYGDEVATDINAVAQSLEAAGLIPPGASALVPSVLVGRTGYQERDITDYEAVNGKADFSLNFRPFNNSNTEIILNSRLGFGNSIYQGASRYQLKNFLLQQHKLEVKGDDFFVRGYATTETAGDSYDMRFTGININRINASEWFGTYVGAYLTGVTTGATPEQAHAGARVFADENVTLQPGTPEFKAAFDKVTSNPDVSVGSKFVDNSKMYVGEGNYNFKTLLNDAMDLQVGGSFRRYSLDSGGTIFTDYDGPIEYDEYGAYVQGIKKFLDDRLKLTGSIRYDKSNRFDPSYSPRVSVVYSAGENKNHNFRASFQTGFRNPDTQSQFIGLNVGRAILVGSAEDNLDRRLPGTNLTGRDAYFDSYSLASVTAFTQSGDPSLLVPVQTPLVEQEKVSAFDVGYRGQLDRIFLDINAYYNIYDGFISSKLVVTPRSGSAFDASGIGDLAIGNFDVFQLYTNSQADVSSYGVVTGLSTKFAENYQVGLSYTYAKFDFDQASDPDFRAAFNTPEHQVKFSFGNPEVFKNFGFNINARWSDEFLWESTIANAIIDSRTVLDAQINYAIPKLKSVIKVGGTNIGGEEYRSAPGAGSIGSQYYISLTINN